MKFRFCARMAGRWIVACSLALIPLAAQTRTRTTTTDEPKERPPVSDRFNIGFRAGVPFVGLVSGVSSVESTSATDPPTTTSTAIDSKGVRLTLGPTFEYVATNDLTFGVDVLYRRAGYDSTISVSSQTTNDDDGELLYQSFEKTRLNYWDVPIMARYFPGHADPNGTRPYLLGGVALRFASGVSTTMDVVDQDGVTNTDKTPIPLANDLTFGGMVGAGVRVVDDVGIKVDFEVRFTRWNQPVIQQGAANSNQNQAEFVFGMTF
ncbi:MAG: outer membrane beta-barrel protein [Acidobacteria bacterium]|nr:outer membrane beta-barrel protein [Acidobacteriota bacterium]